MILLWGVADEDPMRAVRAALQDLRAPCFVLDQNRIAETSLHYQVAGGQISGELRCGCESVPLHTIKAAYLRPYAPGEIPAIANAGPGSRVWQHAAHLGETLWTWADTTGSLVLNRPSAMESNHSKPWQAALIRQHGFATADTIISNDARAVRRFIRRHRTVIYKSISSRRSIVRRITNGRDRRWNDLRHCPTQFQQFVPGTDVRVHAVAGEIFACAVKCEVTDYRYSAPGPEMQAYHLPASVAARCVGLAEALGLAFVGIDLRITPEGEWVCFEVNPSPGFTFFPPVATAVARAVARTLRLAWQPV